jgi:outer membrane immunogenic protein
LKAIIVALALMITSIGQTFAADLPEVAPLPKTYIPTYAGFNWSGFYIGVNGAYGFGTSTWTAPGFSTGSFNPTGVIVGGTLGINYQSGGFVLGLEGDAGYSAVKGSAAPASGVCNSATGAAANCQTNGNLLATLRARPGYSFGRVLLYGTGGGAFGNVRAGLNPPGSFDSSIQFGWAGGAGIEVGFPDPNWTAKVEYLYVDLPSISCSTASANCGPTFAVAGGGVSFKENIVRAGLNYRFSF